VWMITPHIDELFAFNVLPSPYGGEPPPFIHVLPPRIFLISVVILQFTELFPPSPLTGISFPNGHLLFRYSFMSLRLEKGSPPFLLIFPVPVTVHPVLYALPLRPSSRLPSISSFFGIGWRNLICYFFRTKRPILLLSSF